MMEITLSLTQPNGKYKDFEVSLQDIKSMYRVLACITMK